MMRSWLTVLFVVLGIAVVFAAPVTYQGKLTDATGVGINDTVNIAIAVYDDSTAGTLVDGDTVLNVVVFKGLFSTTFDLDIPSSYITLSLYLQLAIDDGGGWSLLSPRQPVNAEFRAMWADNAVNAIFADTAYFAVAGSIFYDNATSGLAATDVQSAIDELATLPPGGSLQDAYDLGNTITTSGGNAVEITVPYNGGYGLRVIGNDTDPAIYARNDFTGNAIYCSGDFRISGSSTVRIYSTADINFQLDRDGGIGTINNFRIRDDADAIVFEVDETGLMSTNAIIAGDSISLGGVWRSTWPTGGASDSNFIQNQDTVPQTAKFWVENEGNFGTYMTATEIDIWTDDFEDGDISDWDTTQYLSGGAVWTITNPGGLTPRGGCTGVFLSVDDDYVGSGITTSASAISPVIDLSPYAGNSIYLEFNHWYNHITGEADVCSLFVYDGAIWQLIATYTDDDSSFQNFDISTYANANFQIKFKYDDGNIWAWYWMIDNLRIYYVNPSTPVPTIIADGPAGNIELTTTAGDVIFDGVGLKTTGGAGIVGYDNATSGLTATDVQSAIDELNANIDGLGTPDDYIQNQDTIAQSADFWISDKGYFGIQYSFTDAWCESYETVADSLTPPPGWAVDTVNDPGTDPAVLFEGSTKYPSGYSPSEGAKLVRFNSYNCPDSASVRLKQTSGTDMTALLWTRAGVTFDMFRDDGYSSADDHIVVQYSTDGGTVWNNVEVFSRYSAAGDYWEQKICYLPSSVLTETDLRIAFLFVSDYGNDVYIDNVCLSEIIENPQVTIENGNVDISGALTVSGNSQFNDEVSVADTLKVAHYRDSSGDNLLRSSDGSITITEDADGSWNLTTLAVGGCVTLDEAYDCGGPGVGRQIVADTGPVEIDATGATNSALSLFADDIASATLYISHSATPPGNGIWNDANYWTPTGNIAVGTGYYHTDNGLFQSNVDFICKIDANNDANDTFRVQNSIGTDVFKVDEAGNIYVDNGIYLLGGGGGAAGANTYRNDWESQNVITVGLANADFTNIEQAIVAANALTFAIVKIAPGTYTLANPVVVNSTVVLRGSGKDITIINGASITLSPDSRAYYIHFDNEVFLNGAAIGCWFSRNTSIGAGFGMDRATARECRFDGPDTVALVGNGKLYQCSIRMPVYCEGTWFISDCDVSTPFDIHLGSATITEVHIDGCDFFAGLTISENGVFAYIESNRFAVSGPGGPPAISVSDSAAAEIKANHFTDCATGVFVGPNGSAAILSNDFTANISYAVSGTLCAVNVIGNDVQGMGITTTGIRIADADGVVKDNHIRECTGSGIHLQNCVTNFLVDNNVCRNNAFGISLAGGIYQILRNTLQFNTTTDLDDSGTLPASVASYNVLDTYNPIGVWGGALNTDSSGTLFGGAQPGQLP